ncbi:MAG: response regulator [Paracoccaceae bacterium]
MTTDDKCRSVLILEDETVVAMDIALSLEEAGFTVQGPFKTASKALASLENEQPAFGVLDLNLGNGETSEAVAARLADANCPFVFLTGYEASSHAVIRRFNHVSCISKPVDMDTLEHIVRSAL